MHRPAPVGSISGQSAGGEEEEPGRSVSRAVAVSCPPGTPGGGHDPRDDHDHDREEEERAYGALQISARGFLPDLAAAGAAYAAA
jgi:hypothetical protein